MTIQIESGFGEYRNRVFHYYQEKRYGDALAVAVEASKRFPEYDAKTAFWIACLRSRLGKRTEAIQTLRSATRRGLWWPAGTLQDSDLDAVRDLSEFKLIEEDCRRLRQQAPKTANPELMVRVPAGYSLGTEWPAMVVFHGRYGERPEVSAQEWLPILSTGTILAAPWASQVYAWDGRCWDDWELAEKDVKWAFSELSTKYSIDATRLVLGGFSQGAALSIYAALKRLVPSRGFVAMAPSDWVQPEERRAVERSNLSEPFANFVKTSDCRGIKGAVIIGEQDPFFPKIKQLYALMVERGLNGRLLVEPGIGHEYPGGFESKLLESVGFVIRNS